VQSLLSAFGDNYKDFIVSSVERSRLGGDNFL